MVTRRKVLQAIGATLGSTMLPTGAIAAVSSSSVTSAATVTTAAAVARKFVTSVVLDPSTFAPKFAVAIVRDNESQYLPPYDIERAIDSGKSTYEFIDYTTPETEQESNNRRKVNLLQEILKQQGLPALTDKEIDIIMSEKKVTI